MKDKAGTSLTSQEISQKVINRFINILKEFEILILHCVGYVPSHHVRRFFYRASGIRIGSGSTIHTGARFYEPKNIRIGNDSIIGERAVLDGRGLLTIGDHVAIATDVMIFNSEHNIHDENFSAITEPVTIEDYVFIGPGAIIQPGVVIKKGAVVAAGAVVTKDVDEYMLVGGVPAKPIGERRTKNLHYKLGRARWFR